MTVTQLPFNISHSKGGFGYFETQQDQRSHPGAWHIDRLQRRLIIKPGALYTKKEEKTVYELGYYFINRFDRHYCDRKCKNINVGIVGLAMAFFIGTMGGMKLKIFTIALTCRFFCG